MKGNEVRILLVEDDDIDVMAAKRALRKMQVTNQVREARDGIEALEILRGSGGQEVFARPHIVLLDLNMPRMGGLEFLEEIRNDPILHDTIVFVLTTSNSDEDKCQAYAKNVAGYLLKSNIDEGFGEAVAMLDLYWQVVELPA